MAIRRVTRYVGDSTFNLLRDGRTCDISGPFSHEPSPGRLIPVALEINDGKEEPRVKTRERRIAGWGRINDELHTFFMSEVESVGANKDGLVPATLIIHEPVPEPTLVEAAEEHVGYCRSNHANLKSALDREKQKSTPR